MSFADSYRRAGTHESGSGWHFGRPGVLLAPQHKDLPHARSITPAEAVRFIRWRQYRDRPPPSIFCLELKLHLATEITPIWQATEATLTQANVDPPFWAFAWAGGQALARHVLDRPDSVRGRRVLDFGAGSGMLAIVAAQAGAVRVRAAEIDPIACAAIRLNAALNHVEIEIIEEATSSIATSASISYWSATCATSAIWPNGWYAGCAPRPAAASPCCWAIPVAITAPPKVWSRLPATRCRTSLELEDRIEQARASSGG